MEHMQVFAGSWAGDPSGWDYGAVYLSGISVTGVLGTSDPLVADFTYTWDTDVLSPGDTVYFSDASHGGMDPYTYAWDFGDGAASAEQNPTHVYDEPGTYTVKLTVTPFRCVPKTVTKTVTVEETGYLNVIKYYDSNVNGVRDPGEDLIAGWKFTIGGEEYFTPATVELPVGEYTVTEVMPFEACWMGTTPASFDVTVYAGPAPESAMYATACSVGSVVPVNLDPYVPETQVARLNPSNALGPFDATDPSGVSLHFFATGARTWSCYTFGDKFMNVEGAPDIEFAEVTWGNGGSWHTEAVKVYLTGAVVRDEDGELVEYGASDDGIGYYAGIAWNRIGLEYVDAATRLAVTQGYFSGTRDFADNVFYRSGPYGTYTQFHLPDEVVCAEGLYLEDITADVYDLAYPASYLDVAGAGALVTLREPYSNPVTAADVTAVYGYNGNTDGYDLDAIRVYRCETVEFGNVCLGYGGGLTPGFWSNKNGEKLVGADDLAMLAGLNLRKADGSDFDPAGYAAFKSWLLDAKATNMAYMLSVQLAAMELNVYNGSVDGDALIYAPGALSADALGFATIDEVMAEANDELGLHGSTPSGSPDRAYQEALKNALDRANNNHNFLQSEPCTFSYPD